MAGQAAESADVQSVIVANQRVPCLCSQEAQTRTLSFATSRGHLIEYVQCRACGAYWQRHTHE